MTLVPRPLQADDAEAALALLHSYDRLHFGRAVLTSGDLASAWADPDFSLAHESEGWFDEDALVAFMTLDPQGQVELAVDPDWVGAGLEDVLAGHGEALARQYGMSAVRRLVAESDVAGREALQQRGYHWHHTCWVLALEPGAEVVVPAPPAGYTVHPLTELDAEAAHAVVVAAFGEWGGTRRSYAGWRADVLDRPDATPAHSRVATHDGQLVAACLVVDPEPGQDQEIWVAQLAVDREHRDRGLARLLLAEVITAARGRGVPGAALSTDTRTGALDLYRRLGFEVRHTLQCWQLDLGAATDSPAPFSSG